VEVKLLELEPVELARLAGATASGLRVDVEPERDVRL